MTRTRFFGLVLVVLAAAYGLWWMLHESQTAPSSVQATFVSPETCFGCHDAERLRWHGSHHHMAMDVANADTVLADFDDASFTHGGVTTRFFRKGKGFAVETDGADGELQTFDVDYVFGVEPLQQYLVELPGGRLQALPLAWDSRPASSGGQQWFHLFPDEPLPAGAILED